MIATLAASTSTSAFPSSQTLPSTSLRDRPHSTNFHRLVQSGWDCVHLLRQSTIRQYLLLKVRSKVIEPTTELGRWRIHHSLCRIPLVRRPLRRLELRICRLNVTPQRKVGVSDDFLRTAQLSELDACPCHIRAPLVYLCGSALHLSNDLDDSLCRGCSSRKHMQASKTPLRDNEPFRYSS